jgi:hypothetical protein
MRFHSGAGHSGNNGRIIGGTEGSGSLVYSGSGKTWSRFAVGNGGKVAIDPTDGNYIYGAEFLSKVYRSTTGGAPASFIYGGITDAGIQGELVSSFVLDPKNPNVMVVAGNSVWRSTNVKAAVPTWSKVVPRGDATTLGHAWFHIGHIAIAPGNPDVIWYSQNNGVVFKMTSAGYSSFFHPWGGDWQSASKAWTILIDKDNHDVVYVGGEPGLQRTLDGGLTWQSLNYGSGRPRIQSIQRHPLHPFYLYLGTDRGVYASGDAGASWSAANEGPADGRVSQLFWTNNDTLVAATMGRGMFTTSVTVQPNVLAVLKGGAGTGFVSRSPAGISCGTSSTCFVSMNDVRSVTPFFKLPVTVTVTKSGAGGGTVTSSPAGINCGNTCSYGFEPGPAVTLTATPDAYSVFAGWTNLCAGGTSTCQLISGGTLGATFNPSAFYTLSVLLDGSGMGTVVSNPSGINCGSACGASYAAGKQVTLTASPAAGSYFAGWTGACAGASNCTVSMTAARNVTAIFNAGVPSYPLTVYKSGTGSGPVTSSPPGITCGSNCSASYTSGASVTLTATANPGSVFAGWTGACSGMGPTCVVTMSSARQVTATYNKAVYTLSISKAGNGSGPVTSNPAGITCGSTCTAGFTAGTRVILTAAPNSGSGFAGWSGACSGSSTTCSVDMNAAKTVTATFNKAGSTLSISKSGTGSGPVTSTPAGITCGSTCNANFAQGTSVTLTATPNTGSLFTGWSGACSGTANNCNVTIDAAKAVTATYQAIRTLTVTKSGSGAGSVNSSPGGINCGSTCTAGYPHGTSVTLTAITDDPFTTFAGWSGACSGTASTCVVSLSQPRSVGATFTSPFGGAR